MANLDGLEEALVKYIMTEVNPKAKVDANTDLLAGEVLDSLGILAIIGFVEDRYGLEIEAEEVSLESFRTVAAIRQLVADKLSP
ncbi:MAG: acyl carrier protein [Acidimicrobiia bacterium]